MKKREIRSLNELQDAIDKEISWRKQELSTIKLGLLESNKADKPAGKVALRAAQSLLYAHWEGWIKEISKLYIEFLNSRRLKINELSAPFMGTALKQYLEKLKETTKAELHTSFSFFIINNMDQKAVFNDKDLPIKSNLNFARFKEIIYRFGLKLSNYDTLEKKIDADLLAKRNEIAHGERTSISKDSYLELHDLILEQLSNFTTDILNSAATKAYKSTS